MYAKAVYLDWSGKMFAVLGHKLDNILHASSIAGIETMAICCLPGLCLHHKGKLQRGICTNTDVTSRNLCAERAERKQWVHIGSTVNESGYAQYISEMQTG